MENKAFATVISSLSCEEISAINERFVKVLRRLSELTSGIWLCSFKLPTVLYIRVVTELLVALFV